MRHLHLHLLALALPALVSATTLRLFPRDSAIVKREEACADLRVNANNGDRKVALVIDSSGSMSSNDPGRRRIDAGRSLADFLISSGEAGGKTPDKLTVVDFDDTAKVIFPLGDPSGANATLSKIDASGGTNIASGVNKALDLLTVGDTGATDKRSAIVVFTDGSDGSQTALVNAIRNATKAGIRVSFGFLDPAAGQQSKEILKAVRESRGVYATITAAAGSINFINYVLLNGLTYQDNPQGYDSQLLAGLSQTYTISGSTVTLKYQADAGEVISFRVVSIGAGTLTSVAQMGGSTISPAGSSSTVSVTAPNSGVIELQVSPRSGGAPQDALFSVTTTSNVPLKNCTVGVGPADEGGGLSVGAKAGIGVGVTVAVLGLLGGGGYFAFKHFHVGGAEGGIGAAPPGDGGVSSNVAANGGNTTNIAPGFEKAVPASDVMPAPPDGGNGLAPSAGGQGGFGPNAGGFGGDGGLGPAAGQNPLNLPPGMSPPPPVGSPGVFVPVFVPPVLPPGSPPPRDSADHSRTVSPSLPYSPPHSPPPLGFGPPQWQPQGGPPFNGYQTLGSGTPSELGGHLQQTLGSSTPSELGGHLQQTLGSSTPSELGGSQPGPNAPPGHGGMNLTGTEGGFSQPPGVMPNHTGSTFAPGSGDISSFPSSHGDVGPGPYGAPYPGPPGAVPPAGGPFGPTNPTVYVPGSSFGMPGQEGQRNRHHHHHWLPPYAPCGDRDCTFHPGSHVCQQGCQCTCQDPNCPLNR
ncbi:hypothetical protein RB595_003164 [Gaeumannomyces hyphopodioides]